MKSLGVFLIAISVLAIATSAYGLFLSPYSLVLLKVMVFLIVTAVFGLLGWLGYSMIKLPQPKELKEVETEIEKLVRAKKCEG